MPNESEANALHVGRLVIGPSGSVNLGSAKAPFAGTFILHLDAALLQSQPTDVRQLPAVEVNGTLAIFADAANASTDSASANGVRITSAANATIAVHTSSPGALLANSEGAQRAQVFAAFLAAAQSCAGGACDDVFATPSSLAATLDAQLTLQGVAVDASVSVQQSMAPSPLTAPAPLRNAAHAAVNDTAKSTSADSADDDAALGLAAAAVAQQSNVTVAASNATQLQNTTQDASPAKSYEHQPSSDRARDMPAKQRAEPTAAAEHGDRAWHWSQDMPKRSIAVQEGVPSNTKHNEEGGAMGLDRQYHFGPNRIEVSPPVAAASQSKQNMSASSHAAEVPASAANDAAPEAASVREPLLHGNSSHAGPLVGNATAAAIAGKGNAIDAALPANAPSRAPEARAATDAPAKAAAADAVADSGDRAWHWAPAQPAAAPAVSEADNEADEQQSDDPQADSSSSAPADNSAAQRATASRPVFAEKELTAARNVSPAPKGATKAGKRNNAPPASGDLHSQTLVLPGVPGPPVARS